MTARELFAGASASVEANYIEDVFSTYIYTGNGGSQTITNGIDLATKGGLVWLKSRSAAVAHTLYDTARGVQKYLISNETGAQDTISGVTAFNTTGFNVGSYSGGNGSGENIVSWTFRKQAKFFTICTWTGTGVARTISHDLGSTPGMIIVKRTGTTGNWQVYHRSLTSAAYSTQLNLTNAQASATTVWNSTAPTSSVFSVGTDATVNASGGTYVAYLFAHDAGGFGAAGTDSVVSCGSYTGNGSASGPTVTLGWEPAYLLIKRTDSTGDWNILDNVRGMAATDYLIKANISNAETSATNLVTASSTGFQLVASDAQVNASSGTYIYLAIRKNMK